VIGQTVDTDSWLNLDSPNSNIERLQFVPRSAIRSASTESQRDRMPSFTEVRDPSNGKLPWDLRGSEVRWQLDNQLYVNRLPVDGSTRPSELPDESVAKPSARRRLDETTLPNYQLVMRPTLALTDSVARVEADRSIQLSTLIAH
jgi:hypothetical protein